MGYGLKILKTLCMYIWDEPLNVWMTDSGRPGFSPLGWEVREKQGENARMIDQVWPHGVYMKEDWRKV